MEVKQQLSGLATPPALVSPLPIKTSMSPPTHSSDGCWKVVGSPPRQTLLSPPEHGQTKGVNVDNKVPVQDQQATPATPSPSSSRTLTEGMRAPVLQILNNTKNPNGNLSSGSLDNKGSVSSDQSGTIRNSGNELDSPLSLSSFIWNGVVAEDSIGKADQMRRSSLGGMSAGLYEDEDPQNGLFSLSSVLHAEPFIPARERSDGPRSLPSQGHFPTQQFSSLSHPPDTNFSLGGTSRGSNDYGLDFAATSSGTVGVTGVSGFRMPLQTMHEVDAFEPRVSRMRSHSTSATFGSTLYGGLLDSAFEHAEATDPFIRSTMSFSSSLDGTSNQDRYRGLNGSMTSGAVWTAPSEVQPTYGSMARNHQRSFTSSSHISPIWETPGAYLQHLQDSSSEQEAMERQRVLRRYSLAPSSGHQNYDRLLDSERFGVFGEGIGGHTLQDGGSRYSPENDQAQIQRRHSVAVPTGSYARHGASALGHLEASLESMTLNNDHHMNPLDLEEYRRNTSDLGKGLTLSQVSHHGTLYAVEFKAGRKDLFYVADNSGLSLKRGDLVIVEADRGKDLGKITNDSITPTQVQALAREYAESANAAAAAAAAISGQQENTQRLPKEIHPKRIFRTAYTSEIAQLVNKSYDENKALITCQSKVRQKKLQMEVVDAEYQWDRRKLTFYFISDSRIDFRELVRDLFKMYKTRIWMCAVNAAGQREHERSEGGSSPPRSMMSSPKALQSPPFRFEGPTNVQMPFNMPTSHRQHYTMPTQNVQPQTQHQRAYSDQPFLYRQQSQQDQTPSWQPYYTQQQQHQQQQQQQHHRRLGDTPQQHDSMFHNTHEGFDPRLLEEEFPRLGHYD
ncbi:hypothetical protein EMPS_06734 [Entomortierella parvispora]|uniref:PSP1 C-terminal domain-containing protein n=1 Tax=Entomortierella parvispora TaxID=205924 RepID=A0A9P3HCS6_9FUNG|nr:hypothetical protein EMPS_06734 [Entomortierella parvispora]